MTRRATRSDTRQRGTGEQWARRSSQQNCRRDRAAVKPIAARPHPGAREVCNFRWRAKTGRSSLPNGNGGQRKVPALLRKCRAFDERWRRLSSSLERRTRNSRAGKAIGEGLFSASPHRCPSALSLGCPVAGTLRLLMGALLGELQGNFMAWTLPGRCSLNLTGSRPRRSIAR